MWTFNFTNGWHGNQFHLANKIKNYFVKRCRYIKFVLSMSSHGWESYFLLVAMVTNLPLQTKNHVHCWYLYTKSGLHKPSNSWDIEKNPCCHGNLLHISMKITVNSLVWGLPIHKIWPSHAFKWPRYWLILLILLNNI